MLNSQPKDDKIKNELVFKLLKSTSPYVPNSDNDIIKQQLLSIIQKSAQEAGNNIIHQLTEQDQLQQKQSEYVNDRKKNKGIAQFARKIASRVVDITVKNGNILEIKAEVQSAIQKQLQLQKQQAIRSVVIRKQIQNIQKSVFNQFRIKKQGFLHTNESNKYSYSSLKSIISDMPTARTTYETSSKYQDKNLYNNQVRPNTQRYIGTHTANNKYLDQNSEKFLQFRLGLSQVSSPIKSYRHQNPPINHRSGHNWDNIQKNMLESNRKQRSRQKEEGFLGIESTISNNNKRLSRIKHSQSEAVLPKNKNRKQQFKRSIISKTVAKQKLVKSVSTVNEMPRSKSTLFLRSKVDKVSQSLTKQSQKLDMEVISSILHKKISDCQKNNTIAALLK